ncbi:MAG: ABC transporter ATP-binding protein [Clostridiales bacterium]|nr:ABC transporter ATP-binding protein [Clostridiales bacterium]
MAVLEVTGLRKQYPSFLLDDVSFSLEKGRIMGFIGRNGAGKTTTLKSIFRLVQPDAGDVRVFGMDMKEHEREIKQRIGYAGGAVDYYKRKKIRDIIAVTKTFYDSWDEEAYRRYMDAFSLDENKTPMQLSEGMRVKFSLVLSLSHRAELLILDEPTSGLDPVSREELLETFLALRDHGVSILYSTHITSDLEKCADDITYIAKGKIVTSGPLQAFLADCAANGAGERLDDIMVHYEKESLYEKLAQ